jgi:hypothetical protein
MNADRWQVGLGSAEEKEASETILIAFRLQHFLQRCWHCAARCESFEPQTSFLHAAELAVRVLTCK